MAMSTHDHDHQDHGSELSETQLRVRALETILTEKGYVDPSVLDLIVEHYETQTGPTSGHASSPRPGPIPTSSGRCWRTRPWRSARSPRSAASATT